MDAPFAFRAGGTVSRAFRTYLAALAGLWSIALLIAAVQRFALHNGYPFNTFLYDPTYRFGDFTIFDARFAVWGQGDRFFSTPGFPYTYPAPVLLSELAYYKMSGAPLAAYLATVVLFAIAAGLLIAMAVPTDRRIRPLAIAAALATAMFSYPLFYLCDRANVEGFVWIASSAGLLFFAIRRYSSAAIFFAVATAMKIFPGLLLLLLLAKRRYRDFCLALAACLGITLGCLWLTGPSIARAAQGIAAGMDNFRHVQVLQFRPAEIGFEHSLFGAVKQVAFRLFHDVARVNNQLPRIYLIYAFLAVASFAILYAGRIRRLPVLNQILALSALSIVLPFISFDYTLVHMFAPFGLLVLALARDAASGRLRLTRKEMLLLLLPFAVVFTPQTYLVHSVVSFAGNLKACALLSIVASAVAIPLPSSLFNELPERPVLELQLEVPAREYA